MINPMLYIDFYKASHAKMYPENMKKIVSYLTPRDSEIDGLDSVITFGLQGFIKEFLIDDFNRNFFDQPLNKAAGEYFRIMDNTLGSQSYDKEKIKALHNLGYIPIEISAIPEGTIVPVKIPIIQITNSHPDFPWAAEYIESMLLSEMWHGMIAAKIGYLFRCIVNKYYEISADDDILRNSAISDFSFRGQESLSSAIKTSAAFCLSFSKTSTVPAIAYLEKYYNCNCEKNNIAYGLVSTEHSVMCSNYAIDGNEITMLKRMLTELYPDISFSVVADSYDYWNVIDNILPKLKREIMEHHGTMYIRGDSGDPVEVATETVFRLWKIFGGYINDKGYKILDKHIGVVYGDSITLKTAEEIYNVLIKNKFSCCNVLLGASSSSMQYLEKDNNLIPFTRDTFNIAVKASYCEDVQGNKISIYKDPKAYKKINGKFVIDQSEEKFCKKSHRGICCVYRDKAGIIRCSDGYDSETIKSVSDINMFETVFKNGKIIKEYSLDEIRNRLHKGNF